MPLQIPHPSTPLRLYRHLLRESTYLPILCRPWIASHIQQRFRDCRAKNPTRYIKDAHHSLRFMRSANAGNILRLEHLCLMAAGRIGKRRRILATAQLARRPAMDSTELEQSRVKTVLESTPSGQPPAEQKHDWLDNWSVDMVQALARSQINKQTGDWPHPMRRLVDPDQIFDGTNAFGRPFNPKLLRNKLKKHWAGVLKQLQVPLPNGESDHLASLVNGDITAPELKIPPRRPVAQFVEESNPDAEGEQWDWSSYALKPARQIERGNSRRMKSLTGEVDQDPRGPGRPIGLRVIAPRKLQRIYSRIWNMTPMVRPKHQKNPEKEVRKKKNPLMGSPEKWSVSWGTIEHRISPPSPSDLPFFQGFTTKKGHVLPKAGTSSNISRKSRYLRFLSPLVHALHAYLYL
ncbi:hypothetical protein F4802DRAFT_507770 [Xylaria palmicola]|nr:hypothetical protein F4802DRAFT_507770 [Xylaria palmicola]